MKKSNKDLSKVFFNSVEEMNECYGIDAELPSGLYSNADLVCYEILEPFTYEEVCQHVFDAGGLKYFSLEQCGSSLNSSDYEILLNKYDFDNYKGRCFVYVRVNEYLRKHLEKTLIGCEFAHKYDSPFSSERRFISVIYSESLVVDQYGVFSGLDNIMLYPDDHSDPIPYKEWVKQINKQDVEVEG